VNRNQPKEILILSKVLREKRDCEPGREEPPNPQIRPKHCRQGWKNGKMEKSEARNPQSPGL